MPGGTLSRAAQARLNLYLSVLGAADELERNSATYRWFLYLFPVVLIVAMFFSGSSRFGVQELPPAFVLALLTGPGRVWLQHMTIAGLAHKIAPYMPSKG